MKKSINWSILIITVFFTYIFIYGGVHSPYEMLQKPIVWQSEYSQDIYDVILAVKKASEFESVYSNTARGWPYPHNYLSYPNLDFFNYALISIISFFFSPNIFLLTNIFILIGYMLISLTCYWVLTKIGIEHWKSLALTIMYSFAPYHLMRLEWGHIHLASYWIAPIIVYSTYLLVTDKRFNIYFSFLLGLLVSFSGIYYIFFSYVILFFGFVLSNNKIKSFKIICSAFFVTSAVVILVTVFNYASLSSNLFTSTTSPPVNRSLLGGFMLGLKPILFIFPPYWIFGNSYDINILGRIINFVKNIYITENYSQLLGLPILAFFALSSFFLKSAFFKQKKILLITLLTTIAFTSDLFAPFISALSFGMIRGSNRVSIFLMFLLLFYYCKLFQSENHTKYFNFTVFFALSVFLVDSTMYRINRNYDHEAVSEDLNFLKSLDEQLLYEDTILMLPFVGYPEKNNGLVTYHHNMPILSSKKLKISYGGIPESMSEKAYFSVSRNTSSSSLLDVAASNGFNWIVIDGRSGAFHTYDDIIKKCTDVSYKSNYRILLNVSKCKIKN